MTSPFPNPPGPQGQPPRSTPIPGSPPPIPPGSFGAPGFDPAAGGPTPPPMPAGFGGPEDPFGTGGFPAPKKSRGGLGGIWLVIGLVAVAAIGLGVFMAVKGVSKANDALDEVVDQNRPATSIGGSTATTRSASSKTTAENVDAAPEFLWQAGAAPGLATSFDDAIPGSPTKFLEIVIYGDYAFATAQDPVKSDHLDRYSWRDGSVSSPSPESNRDDLEGKTFTIAEVPWDKLQALLATAETELKVEDATTRYFIIDKNNFGDDGLTIRVYVSGPRSSGYVAADATGTITAVYD